MQSLQLQHLEALYYQQSTILQQCGMRQYNNLQLLRLHERQVLEQETGGMQQNRTTHESKQQTLAAREQVSPPRESLEERKERKWSKVNFLSHSCFNKGDNSIASVLSESNDVFVSAPINISVTPDNQFPSKINADFVVKSGFDQLLAAAATIEDERKHDMNNLDRHQSLAVFVKKNSKLRDEDSRRLPDASADTCTLPIIRHKLLADSVQGESFVPPKKRQSEHKKQHQSIKTPPCCIPVKKKAKKSAASDLKKLNYHVSVPKTAQSFPQKLMGVLMNGPQNDNVVTWLPDGKSF
eukprot:1999637-Ditylum_brightwellii.AAC.1